MNSNDTKFLLKWSKTRKRGQFFFTFIFSLSVFLSALILYIIFIWIVYSKIYITAPKLFLLIPIIAASLRQWNINEKKYEKLCSKNHN